MEEYDLVIVGAGPTGLFATFCAGLREINSVTLESLDIVGGQIPKFYPIKMVYDVGGIPGITGKELAANLEDQTKIFNKKIIVNSKVSDIRIGEDGKFDVEVNSNIEYRARAVLLTTGIGSLLPKKLKVEGEDEYDGKGVYYVIKDLKDFTGKKVAVIGGGDAGLDMANQIAGVASKILIIEFAENLRAAESSITSLKNGGKTDIFTRTAVQKISGDGNSVKKITVKDIKSGDIHDIDVDSVVVAIGHDAKPCIFKSLNLETFMNRYVKINDNYETSVPGIFAAGDDCQMKNEIKLGLIAVGFAEAYAAVDNVKKYLNPTTSLFGSHSTELKINK